MASSNDRHRCQLVSVQILVTILVYGTRFGTVKQTAGFTHLDRVIPPVVEVHLLECKINVSARRQVTTKRRDAQQGASKPDNGRIPDEVVVTTGVAR